MRICYDTSILTIGEIWSNPRLLQYTQRYGSVSYRWMNICQLFDNNGPKLSSRWPHYRQILQTDSQERFEAFFLEFRFDTIINVQPKKSGSVLVARALQADIDTALTSRFRFIAPHSSASAS